MVSNTRNLNDDEYLNVSQDPTVYTDTPENPQTVIRGMLYRNEDIAVKVRGRIYDMQMPKNITVPCITLQRISEVIDVHTQIRRTNVQIDCYSESHPEADLIAETVLAVLMNASVDTDNLSVYSITPESTRDLSVPETRLFRVTGEYAVVWRKK